MQRRARVGNEEAEAEAEAGVKAVATPARETPFELLESRP